MSVVFEMLFSQDFDTDDKDCSNLIDYSQKRTHFKPVHGKLYNNVSLDVIDIEDNEITVAWKCLRLLHGNSSGLSSKIITDCVLLMERLETFAKHKNSLEFASDTKCE